MSTRAPRRRSSGRLAALAAGLLLLAGLVLLVAANLEWGEKQVWVGWQGEARTNPFLAAKRFLDGSGRATECIQGLPSAGLDLGLVLLPARARRMSPRQAADLVDFVEAGGVLLAAGAWAEEPGTGTTQDPLFAAFGARRLESDWWERMKDRPPQEIQAFQDGHRTLAVRPGGPESPVLRVHFDLGRRLQDREGRAFAAFGDASGVKVLQVARGAGQAILFSDMDWLRNDAIGSHDHAALLEALAGLADASRPRTVLVVRESAPSLAAWLIDRAPAVLAMSALLVALALWRAAPRFGPRLPDPGDARRSLLEHLEACGRFQWRLQEGRGLLRAARQAALDRLGRVHPGWGGLAPDALCHRIAEHAGLPEERVFRALRYERAADPHGFTEALQTLDRIRKVP